MEEQKPYYPVNMFRICVDELGRDIQGRAYMPLNENGVTFAGIGELLLKMDQLFDSIGFPQGFQHKRSFEKEGKRNNFYHGIPKPMLDTDWIREQHGARYTFDIQVNSRRNTSWQGRICDAEGLAIAQFDSELQLLEQLCLLGGILLPEREKMEKGKNTSQSFVIEVKSQENHSWQGTVTWVQGKKTEHFRSALELMRLMDSTLNRKEEQNGN